MEFIPVCTEMSSVFSQNLKKCSSPGCSVDNNTESVSFYYFLIHTAIPSPYQNTTKEHKPDPENQFKYLKVRILTPNLYPVYSKIHTSLTKLVLCIYTNEEIRIKAN